MKSIEFQKIGWTCNYFDRLTRFAISRWSSRSFFLKVSLSCHVTVRTISRLSQSLVGPVESLGRLGLSLQGLQNSPQFSLPHLHPPAQISQQSWDVTFGSELPELSLEQNFSISHLLPHCSICRYCFMSASQWLLGRPLYSNTHELGRPSLPLFHTLVHTIQLILMGQNGSPVLLFYNWPPCQKQQSISKTRTFPSSKAIDFEMWSFTDTGVPAWYISTIRFLGKVLVWYPVVLR